MQGKKRAFVELPPFCSHFLSLFLRIGRDLSLLCACNTNISKEMPITLAFTHVYEKLTRRHGDAEVVYT